MVKTIGMQFRSTPEFHKILKDRSKQLGLSSSSYLRMLVIRDNPEMFK